jgi:hypothetical protein
MPNLILGFQNFENFENLYLMVTYEELANVPVLFVDKRDEKVHREMCIDAQKNVQNEFEEVLIAIIAI